LAARRFYVPAEREAFWVILVGLLP